MTDADGGDQDGKEVWTLPVDDQVTGTLVELRRWAAANLADLGHEHLTDIMLVAVELVSNAYDHGGGARGLRVARLRAPCVVEIEVDDGTTDPPTLGRSRLPLDACRGRGVLIVDRLSRRWGMTVDSTSGGKTIWAHIACDQNACGDRVPGTSD